MTLSSPPDFAIDIKNLRKVYRDPKTKQEKLALKGVDLAVPRGSVFALLGPNGAGKSTIINILAGIVRKTAGSVKIWGYDLDERPRQSRVSIGIVPQELTLDPFFTPSQSLDIQAGLFGVPKSERRTAELLEVMGLSDKANAYSRSLSGGMRRRLMVAKAMVHQPPILILDEPTAGVDIELRRQLWEYVRTLNAQGVTIVLTTHYLEEAEEMCDTIAIVDKGEIVTCEPKADLLRRLNSKTLTITLQDFPDEIPSFLKKFQVELVDKNQLRFSYQPCDETLNDFFHTLSSKAMVVLDVETKNTDLEDVFMQLTYERI